MSKNKPMSRIDLDYNKNLKYPDINDYLNDTVYASNLTEFPDNQAGAVTAFKLVPDTVDYNFKIHIAGHEWKTYLGTFRMYGYNPDLEAVEFMRLTIDFVNDGEESTNLTRTIRRRNTALFFGVIGISDPKSLPIVGAVNYFVDFGPNDIKSIYDYVFNDRWVQASEEFQGITYTTNPTEAEKQAYINYIKYRIYRIKIPARLEYFYVGATEPGGVLQFNISINELLPTYRSLIDFTSKEVQVNMSGTESQQDYLKVSYITSALGKMQLKAAYLNQPATQVTEPEFRTLNTLRETINTSLSVANYIARQHLSFDIGYPTLLFTYDYANPGGFVELADQDFDSFKAVPRLNQVNSLSIISYRYGHLPKVTNIQTDNPFRVSLTFSCATARLHENQHLRKFQLYFRQAKGSNMDTDPILTYSAAESLLIAGNFFTGSRPQIKFSVGSQELQEINFYRSAGTTTGPTIAQMFTQRTNIKQDQEFEQKELAGFQATLAYNGFINNAHNYTLLITWPPGIQIKGLYNIVKSRWIVLSIADMFQQVFLSGVVEKNVWDRINNDNLNPAYNSTLNYLPTFLVKGASAPLSLITNEELTNMNDRSYKEVIRVKGSTQVLRLNKKELGSSSFNKTISFEVQNLVFNGKNTFNTHTNSFIMLDALVLVAHKIGQAKNFTYLNQTGLLTNRPIYYKNVLSSDAYKVSGTIPNQIDLLIKFADLDKLMKTSLNVKTLKGGVYKVYIIPSLNKVPNNSNQPLYTSQYEINTLKSLKVLTEFIIEYTWSP
jgi:hypothetical protein